MKKIAVILVALSLGVCLTGCDAEVLYGSIAVVCGLIGLFIHICFCSSFARIAALKGHSDEGYFLLCFFFGMIGFIYIAALPDNYRRGAEKIKTPFYKTVDFIKSVRQAQYGAADQTEANSEMDLAAYIDDTEENKVWICRKCDTANSVKYGQCKKCGEYRGLKGTL